MSFQKSFSIVCYNLIFLSSMLSAQKTGSPDATFGVAGKVSTTFYVGDDVVNVVAVQIDGKIIAAGESAIHSNRTFTLVRYNVNGTLDNSFGVNGIVTATPGRIGSIVIQTDGKIVISGINYSLKDRFIVARYNIDGSLDPNFGTEGVIKISFAPSNIYAGESSHLALLPNGKIIVAGIIGPYSALVRLNTNGGLDDTFGTNGRSLTEFGNPQSYNVINSVVVQGDGKILVGGTTNVNFALIRYHPNGSVDSSFAINGKQITYFNGSRGELSSLYILPNGKIIGTGRLNYLFTIVEYNSDGSLNSSFGTGGKVTIDSGAGNSAVKSSFIGNKIVVVGTSSSNIHLVHFNLDGTLDTTFGINGKTTTPINLQWVSDLEFMANGKIIAVGTKFNEFSSYDFAIAQCDSDGSLDKNFNGNGQLSMSIGSVRASPYSVALGSNGKIIVGGVSEDGGSSRSSLLAQYKSNGQLDNNFGAAGLVRTIFSNPYQGGIGVVKSLPDGKILAAGTDYYLVQYNANGSLDTNFATKGIYSVNGFSIAVQTDGNILLSSVKYLTSSDYDYTLTRLKANGKIDSTFGIAGIVTGTLSNRYDIINDIALQTDGKILVTGVSDNNYFVGRYDIYGRLDHTFGNGGIVTTKIGTKGVAKCILLQNDGKIVIGGWTSNDGDKDFGLVRYTVDGRLDNSFGLNGIVTTPISNEQDVIYALKMLPNGEILAVGASYHIDPTNTISGQFNISIVQVRYASDGQLDWSFGYSGIAFSPFGTLGYVNNVAIQPDNKVIAIGQLDGDFAIARYNYEILSTSSNHTDNIFLYPNPATENLIIEFERKKQEKVSIQLFDVQGKLIKSLVENRLYKVGKYEQRISLPPNLANGTYFISISSETDRQTVKFIK